MKTLSETWFAEGYIDFELKKYTLLAYLQHINKGFSENRLYPELADIIFHYNNIVAFRDNKKTLQNNFPKRLSGIQLQRLTLLYEQVIEDDELMKELEDIMYYASAQMQQTISDGTGIYEFVEDKIIIQPVGLVPLDNSEGYFFLINGNDTSTHVYQYRLSIFEKHDEKYRSIKTNYVDKWSRSISCTHEHIKSELIRKKSDLPNPAVYAMDSSHRFPVEETLLPVAKRILVKFISSEAA
ncbi:MAG: hypothetical protein QM791_22580 [Ferruginibacter sp.]